MLASGYFGFCRFKIVYHPAASFLHFLPWLVSLWGGFTFFFPSLVECILHLTGERPWASKRVGLLWSWTLAIPLKRWSTPLMFRMFEICFCPISMSAVWDLWAQIGLLYYMWSKYYFYTLNQKYTVQHHPNQILRRRHIHSIIELQSHHVCTSNSCYLTR